MCDELLGNLKVQTFSAQQICIDVENVSEEDSDFAIFSSKF